MAAKTPLAFEPVHRLRDRMSQGETSPVEIVAGYLDRTLGCFGGCAGVAIL